MGIVHLQQILFQVMFKIHQQGHLPTIKSTFFVYQPFTNHLPTVSTVSHQWFNGSSVISHWISVQLWALNEKTHRCAGFGLPTRMKGVPWTRSEKLLKRQWRCHRYGGFLKWGYPQIIHLIGFSNMNQKFCGIPICGNLHITWSWVSPFRQLFTASFHKTWKTMPGVQALVSVVTGLVTRSE